MLIDPPRGARLHLARLTMLPDTKAKFRAQGVTRGAGVICYCGGGSRPLISCAPQLGYDDLTLYDGSIGEWAKDLSLPIESTDWLSRIGAARERHPPAIWGRMKTALSGAMGSWSVSW